MQSLENMLASPWLKRKVEQGRLILHGWYFDIGTGSLMAYSPRQQQFLPMVCPIANQPRVRYREAEGPSLWSSDCGACQGSIATLRTPKHDPAPFPLAI